MSQLEPRELLRTLRSGYPKGPEAFDRLVMRRDPRTVRRWVSGSSPIPKPVLAYLENVRRQIRVDNSEPVSQIVDPINEARD